MLNFQILLANLHDWVTQNYFAPEWRTLSLKKASRMIYCKAGRVRWHDDQVTVELEPYRYPDQAHRADLPARVVHLDVQRAGAVGLPALLAEHVGARLAHAHRLTERRVHRG